MDTFSGLDGASHSVIPNLKLKRRNSATDDCVSFLNRRL